MSTGEKKTDHSPLEESLEQLPTALRGFFQKVIDGVKGALQVTLIDTLVGEFHERFNTMWNNPGNRDTARALRQCDRTHRETAAKVVKEVLVSQLTLLARAVVSGKKDEGFAGDLPDGVLSIFESKIARLEEMVTTIEQMREPSA